MWKSQSFVVRFQCGLVPGLALRPSPVQFSVRTRGSIRPITNAIAPCAAAPTGTADRASAPGPSCTSLISGASLAARRRTSTQSRRHGLQNPPTTRRTSGTARSGSEPRNEPHESGTRRSDTPHGRATMPPERSVLCSVPRRRAGRLPLREARHRWPHGGAHRAQKSRTAESRTWDAQ